MNEPRYYEDWTIGERFVTPPRVVTQTDVDHFAEVEAAKNPLHLDPEYAKGSVFGELTVHGLLTVSMAAGMMGASGMFDGTALAFLGLNWQFVEPVRVGDELRVRWWVDSKRLTSRPGRGVVVRSIEVLNQEEVVVCHGEMSSLWALRDDGDDA